MGPVAVGDQLVDAQCDVSRLADVHEVELEEAREAVARMEREYDLLEEQVGSLLPLTVPPHPTCTHTQRSRLPAHHVCGCYVDATCVDMVADQAASSAADACWRPWQLRRWSS